MDNQYQISGNQVVLKVKKASLFIRLCLFLFAALAIVLPLGSVIANFSIDPSTISILQITLFFILLFVSLFVFRLGLWNTFGQEEFYFGEDSISYQANYRWFKDKQKKYAIEGKKVSLSYQVIGFKEDKKGVMLIQLGEKKVGSAVKMPIEQLEQICQVLNTKYAS